MRNALPFPSIGDPFVFIAPFIVYLGYTLQSINPKKSKENLDHFIGQAGAKNYKATYFAR